MARCPRCGRPSEGVCDVCRGGKTLFLGSAPSPKPTATPPPAPAQTALMPSSAPAARGPTGPRPSPAPPPGPAAPPKGSERPSPPNRRVRKKRRLDERLSAGIRLTTTLRNLVARPPPSQREQGRAGSSTAAKGIAAALIGGLCAGLLTVGVWLLWPKRASAVARVGSDGQQVLDVSCGGCADGTDVSIGASHARILGGRAQIALSAPVPPSTKTLLVNTAPPTGSPSTLELDVQVCGRLSPDLAHLADEAPSLVLIAEVPPGGSVIVDGNALLPDANGRASYQLPIVEAISGDADQEAALSRKLPFSLTAPKCEEQRGAVELALKIAPLRVSAPSASIVLERDSFMLAGKAQPGATVTVEGRGIHVDETGEFAQRMTISKLGEREITIRSTVPGFAPRLVKRRIRRVADLLLEANALARKAPSKLDDVLNDNAGTAPLRFALRGRVTAVEAMGHSSRILVAADACEGDSCSVQVEHGAAAPAFVGDHVLAVGEIDRRPGGNGPVLRLLSEILAVDPVGGGP